MFVKLDILFPALHQDLDLNIFRKFKAFSNCLRATNWLEIVRVAGTIN